MKRTTKYVLFVLSSMILPFTVAYLYYMQQDLSIFSISAAASFAKLLAPLAGFVTSIVFLLVHKFLLKKHKNKWKFYLIRVFVYILIIILIVVLFSIDDIINLIKHYFELD